MRSRLRAALGTRRALIAIVAALVVLSWAIPTYGASTFKLAVKALGRANTAIHDSALAVDTSNGAKTTANTANSTANAAKSTANTALSTANTANTTANTALSKANGIVTPAFAHVPAGCASPSGLLGCTFNRSSGVTSVAQTSTAGQYCITASGHNSSTSSWIAQVDVGGTSSPDQTAVLVTTGSGCSSGQFQVQTNRSGTGASDVAFFVMIG